MLDKLQAVRYVTAGKVIAYPAEAVYGLGCDPMNEQAVSNLLDLKQRHRDKGLIVIGSNLDQFETWVKPLTEEQMAPAVECWPGPFTWLLPATNECPDWVRGVHDTVAVRISSHPVCRKLCELFGGPLISTSANPFDKPPARSVEQIEEYFHDGLAGVVQGALGGLEQPTPIRDLLSGDLIRSS